MNSEQLTKLRTWFDKFVTGHYCDDEFINANVKIKQEHTKCVCEEMLYLADELKLNENQRLLAETTALLHDVGRFPQFVKYRTFNDPRSIDHCALALEFIRKENVLAGLPDNERQLIETAVKYHGVKVLPANLSGDTLLFSKMVRDADKTDIYRVITRAYIQHRDDPDNFKLEIEFPDLPGYTPAILDAVLAGQLLEYRDLRCWNDMKLCVLGWVYDVNFPAALKRIRQRGYLDLVLSFLPDTADTRRVREKILTYVDSRIRQST
ncbi:MAG: HD domain-containing protein [Sedimentisphaerales bacterium]